MINPFTQKRYFVALRFKTERTPVDCLMRIPEYRRMVNDYRLGNTTGTYAMTMDGHEAEYTFPLQELDTVHAVPEVVDDKSSGTTG